MNGKEDETMAVVLITGCSSGFGQLAALEFARKNVQVNALAPGFVDTEINAEFFATPAGRQIIGRFPARSLQQPENLDSALLFLASSASDHITGVTLHVDEGQSLGAFQAARDQEAQ